MTYLQSQSMASDYAYNGITSILQLKEKDLTEFAIQLFDEEEEIGDKISMLIDSEYFHSIPSLLVAFSKPQSPYPSDTIRNDAINSLIKENIRDEITSNLIKCLVGTYTVKMNQLLEEAINELENDQCLRQAC